MKTRWLKRVRNSKRNALLLKINKFDNKSSKEGIYFTVNPTKELETGEDEDSQDIRQFHTKFVKSDEKRSIEWRIQSLGTYSVQHFDYE